jgi:hypothetical protein
LAGFGHGRDWMTPKIGSIEVARMPDRIPTPLHDEVDLHFGGFHKLIPHRVQNVLLVSSLYESFILEEEGLVHELVTSEYLDMNLSHAPRVSRVSTGQEALAFIRRQQVDLVITMTRLGQWNVPDFLRHFEEVAREFPNADARFRQRDAKSPTA